MLTQNHYHCCRTVKIFARERELRETYELIKYLYGDIVTAVGNANLYNVHSLFGAHVPVPDRSQIINICRQNKVVSLEKIKLENLEIKKKKIFRDTKSKFESTAMCPRASVRVCVAIVLYTSTRTEKQHVDAKRQTHVG